MFGEIGTKISQIAKDEVLRKRILFVLGALVVFRVLAAIPIPGIDALRLEEFFSNNQFLGLLNIFSGGGLSNLSIVMLGVAPYITASIIMQLLTVMVGVSLIFLLEIFTLKHHVSVENYKRNSLKELVTGRQ